MAFRFRPAVRLTHAWVGLVLSLLLFVLGLSGSALVYKEAYWRLVYPELRVPDPDPTPAEQAAAIAAAEELFGEELLRVKMPEPGVPAYHLYLVDGEALLSAGDYRLIDRWQPRERLMPLLFDLHAHLMAGDGGERMAGYVSLLGVLLAGTGIFLWWPARKRTGLRPLIPKSLKRKELIPLHRNLGLFTTPILVVVLATGAGLVFYSTTGVLLNGMFGDAPVVSVPPPPPTETAVLGRPDASTIAAARGAYEDARITFYYRLVEGDELHEFRMKQGCELHPNGRSYVHLDGVRRIVTRTEPCTYPPGERLLHATYPLHSGKTSSVFYKLVTFLSGLALAVLAGSGAVAYVEKLRGPRAKAGGRAA